MMNFDEMIKQGQVQSAGLVDSGQLLINVEPEHLRARIVLRNVNPEESASQVLNFLITILTVGAQMVRLEPINSSHGKQEKQRTEISRLATCLIYFAFLFGHTKFTTTCGSSQLV